MTLSMEHEIPQLREKQVEQLAFYIRNPKCLDLSDPGTGKTPPCCVYSWMMWSRGQKKTLWSMPKSLLKKNLRELVRFTDFTVANDKKYTPGDDVAILRTDRAALTDSWTGPTIAATRRRNGYRVRLPGCATETTTFELADLARSQGAAGLKFGYQRADGRWSQLNGSGDHEAKPEAWLAVEPVMGPDDKPQKATRDDPEVFKDLIAAAAADGVKAVICTFAFMSMHWERVLAAFPDIDLLLVDELHMAYGGLESKLTESFFHVNKRVSRFVGMTGTLINGRLDTAFPAIHAIEPRYYGNQQGFYFDHVAAMDDRGRPVRWKNEAKLAAIIERHSIRRTFEEVYGKEDVVFLAESIEMDDRVRAAYDEFHETALLELQDGAILDGSSPGVAMIRARQIMAHPETMLAEIPKWTEKDERLMVHLAKGQKTLIFAALQPEQSRILRLCEELGLRAALINAGVSGPQRIKIDEAAQAGELDVIVASGPTTAVGYNWEMFDLVVFASIDFLDVNILQAYRRASRGSRTKTLHVVFFKYEDSIDDRMYEIVKEKSELANRVDGTRPVLDFTS
jgi:hypothetical protein